MFLSVCLMLSVFSHMSHSKFYLRKPVSYFTLAVGPLTYSTAQIHQCSIQNDLEVPLNSLALLMSSVHLIGSQTIFP